MLAMDCGFASWLIYGKMDKCSETSDVVSFDFLYGLGRLILYGVLVDLAVFTALFLADA